MKRPFKFLVLGLIACCSCISSHARNSDPDLSVTYPAENCEPTDSISENAVEPSEDPTVIDDSDIWKYKTRIMLGFTTGTLDQKRRFGGEISSRWGLSLITGRNIYLHRKAIGGFLKFGLNLDMNLNYMNFAKGTGRISDIMHQDDDGAPVSFGRHYLTAGIAIGPTATFAPFFASSDRNLASLKFRPYFHVVPSYAAYLISEDEDTEIHGAFALWCAAGLEIQWKRLIAGFEWKGCTAKYKGMIDSIISDFDDNYEAEKSHKFDMNMFNVSIGFAF